MTFGKRNVPLPPDRFAPDTWRAIITLPMQVGVWMARVDEGGGAEAQTMEYAAMPAFLKTAGTKFANVPFITQICASASAAQHDVINPLREDALIAKAAEMMQQLTGIVSALELNAYKLLLIEMAEHVARAAPDRDLGPYNLMNGAKDGWYGLYPALLNQTMRYGRGPQVSRAEKAGINRLVDVLNASDMVQKWDLGTPENGSSVRVYSDPYADPGFDAVNQRTTRATP